MVVWKHYYFEFKTMRRNVKYLVVFSVVWFGGFIYYFSATSSAKHKVRNIINNNTCVSSMIPSARPHSPTKSDHYFRLKIVLFCTVLKTRGRTDNIPLLGVVWEDQFSNMSVRPSVRSHFFKIDRKSLPVGLWLAECLLSCYILPLNDTIGEISQISQKIWYNIMKTARLF